MTTSTTTTSTRTPSITTTTTNPLEHLPLQDAVEPGEIVDCVIDSLQSVSDCLLCVCDVLNIFLNGTNQNCVVRLKL